MQRYFQPPRVKQSWRAVGMTAALWLGFTVFMLIRAATLWWRERGDRWLVTGV